MSDFKRRLKVLRGKRPPAPIGPVKLVDLPDGIMKVTRCGPAGTVIYRPGLSEAELAAVLKVVHDQVPGLQSLVVLPDNGRD